jgi:hypothetical protein
VPANRTKYAARLKKPCEDAFAPKKTLG